MLLLKEWNEDAGDPLLRVKGKIQPKDGVEIRLIWSGVSADQHLEIWLGGHGSEDDLFIPLDQGGQIRSYESFLRQFSLPLARITNIQSPEEIDNIVANAFAEIAEHEVTVELIAGALRFTVAMQPSAEPSASAAPVSWGSVESEKARSFFDIP